MAGTKERLLVGACWFAALEKLNRQIELTDFLISLKILGIGFGDDLY